MAGKTAVSKTNSLCDVIFTPVFRNTTYLHHVCSNCGYKLHMCQQFYGGPSFYAEDEVKFCPRCGKDVIRFSHDPIYEDGINFEPFKPFYEILAETDRHIKYLYFVKLEKTQVEAIKELLPFAKDSYGWVKQAADAVKSIKYHKPSWQELKKLEEEFELKSGG